jgi:hypothetical protein
MASNSREPAQGIGAPRVKRRPGRRLRGWLIRLVLNRALSMMLGVMLLTPALWLFVGRYKWETPITDGLELVLGATGAALLFAGLGGRRPDWIDPEDPPAQGS